MKTNGFLLVHSGGQIRFTKRRPTIRAKEVAVPVTITVPDAYFAPPISAVTINLPEPEYNGGVDVVLGNAVTTNESI